MKYKVGDKVRVRKDLVENQRYGGGLFYNENDRMGKVVTISEVLDRGAYHIEEKGDNYVHWTDEMFEPITKTIRDVEVGDLLKKKSFIDKVRVLGVIGEMCAISYVGDHNKYSRWSTFRALEANWTVVQPEPEDDGIVEMTVGEAEKKLKIDAGKLRIKD